MENEWRFGILLAGMRLEHVKRMWPDMSRKMRIALCIETDGPGGAEVLMIQFAQELRERGHYVVPILPTRKVGWLHDRLAESEFQPESIELLGAPVPLSVAMLARILRRNSVEVVHSHEFTMSVVAAFACRRIRARHISTMHGNQEMTRAWKRRVALRLAFRLTDVVTCVSLDTKKHLIEQLGGVGEEIRVVPNGVPQRKGDGRAVRKELSLEPRTLMILAVGGLHPRKGFDVLLQALARMGVGQPWQLIIAGEGPERARLTALANDLGLAEQVRLLGQREDVPDLQAAADLFVMPSLWEGLPLAVLEAMLAGTPVVASAVSGIPEAINPDEEQGLLVPPGDIDALAEAVKGLIVDKERRERVAAAGQVRAQNDFTTKTMIDTYEAMYYGVEKV